MCLARPAGGKLALARRSGYRVSPPRSVRSFWLPQRPYPGFVPLSAAAFKFDRPEGGRQPEWESPGLLAQPGFAAYGRTTGCPGSRRCRSKPDNDPLALPEFAARRVANIKFAAPALTAIQLRGLPRSNAR